MKLLISIWSDEDELATEDDGEDKSSSEQEEGDEDEEEDHDDDDSEDNSDSEIAFKASAKIKFVKSESLFLRLRQVISFLNNLQFCCCLVG